eukprot:4163102-Pleurochrysis_carterae.AAC.2
MQKPLVIIAEDVDGAHALHTPAPHTPAAQERALPHARSRSPPAPSKHLAIAIAIAIAIYLAI